MVAMLITPAATAYLLTHRLPVMMALAAAIGALSGAAGLYLSYYLNVASGAAIVLTCTALFLIVWLLRISIFAYKKRNFTVALHISKENGS
jgi:ABC-type Mn2+/Zn2+ transport system permease subunit